MKFKYLYLRNAVFLLLITALFSIALIAQKKPTSLKLDVDGDDLQLCGGQSNSKLTGSEFCMLYRSYRSNLSNGNLAGAQADRNEMIEIVRGQVDTFYKLRKDGRRSKIRIFQTILDFLQIGGDLAITIMNGERARTVLGAVLAGLDNGNKVYNKNFEVLQTQVLINKMNANRAEIMTEILPKKTLGADQYTWYAAKNDLRRYLFAGTFDNALDTLVNETGSDVSRAERVLRIVEARPIAPAATRAEADTSRDARAVKNSILAALSTGEDPQVKSATEKLQNIIDELDEDPDLNALFEGEGISKTSNGQEIYDALQLIIEDLPETRGRRGRELVNKINQAFIRNK